MTPDELAAHRHQTHGDFADVARIVHFIMIAMQNAPRWDELTEVQTEALHMIAHKIARIVSGNPNIEDHWRDIAGYATLVAATTGGHTVV